MFFYSLRTKRQITQSNNNAQNLYIEYLAVIDSTVYVFFTQLYGNLNPPELLNDYIYIFFSQIINGVRFFIFLSKKKNFLSFKLNFKVNQRYYSTLQGDSDLMLTITLANVLMFLVSFSNLFMVWLNFF